jgi:chromosome condensin MukBEF ATPase and DNA-binding subunit MukB
LEADRWSCVVDLRKEVPEEFMEYRNYNRIDLTMKRGWDKYLPKEPGFSLQEYVCTHGGVDVFDGDEDDE